MEADRLQRLIVIAVVLIALFVFGQTVLPRIQTAFQSVEKVTD